MSKKALVVDNDFFFVEFLTEMLESRGYEVIKAYDGKEGMEKINGETVDILFADIVMPKVDGWQFIKYIRGKFPQRPFPVVAVSGTIIEQLDDLERIGADYYIAKGPMEKMKEQFDGFMENIEQRRDPGGAEGSVFDLGKIYPRRESIELIESLHFQRAILECIGVGVVVVDRDAKVISCNSSALELLDRSEVATLNQKFHLLLPPPQRARLVEAMRSVARQPEREKVALIIDVGAKSLRFVVSLLSVESEYVGWIVVLEDVKSWEEQA